MSNLALKPIETKYRGYRFRSRLEARWAVFFDLLGMQWEYEPEGFKLPSGALYLPDFRVYTPQGQSIWYEVKPGNVKYSSKFAEFKENIPSVIEGDCEWMSPRASVLSGDPMDMVFIEKTRYATIQTNICPRCGLISDETEDMCCRHSCYPCDEQTPSGAGDDEIGVAGITVRPHKGAILVESDLDRERFARIVAKATQAARSARFEHGENG